MLALETQEQLNVAKSPLQKKETRVYMPGKTKPESKEDLFDIEQKYESKGDEGGEPLKWEKGKNGREKAGEFYERKGDNVYYLGYKIEGADSQSLQVFHIFDVWYSKDKNNVYSGVTIIEGADPQTFQVIDAWYSKDKNNIYSGQKKIEGADPQTFQIIGGYAKDKNNVYSGQKKIEGADPQTFQVMGLLYGGFCAKDKNNVYRAYKKVEGADLQTFQPISVLYAKDKSNVYHEGKKVEGANPETFIIPK